MRLFFKKGYEVFKKGGGKELFYANSTFVVDDKLGAELIEKGIALDPDAKEENHTKLAEPKPEPKKAKAKKGAK